MDAVRRAINLYVFNSIQGITFPVWVRLLWDNRFQVHPRYWPRAALLTITSLLNSVVATIEWLVFGWQVRRVEVKSPLVILGHFRAGTTHLHNLLALNPHFAYPTLFQTLNPSTFLCTERPLGAMYRLLMLRQRPQDKVAIGPEVPAEDEVATAILSLQSPYVGWVFPKRQSVYDRCLTLRELSPGEVARWKANLLWFLRKVTWKVRRPLILKSPPHTARIRRLLELFPDARFVHIHRDPIAVFFSTRKLLTALPPYFALQTSKLKPHELDDRIITQYARMYEAFFEERALIPPGQFCEVSYNDLERDPLNTVAAIYQALSIPGFDQVKPALEQYLATIADYQKNTHPEVTESLRSRLKQEWSRCFNEWNEN